MKSRKDLLVLENEYRNELPKYQSKPDIERIAKPTQLKSKITNFLDQAKEPVNTEQQSTESKKDEKHVVEMDIFMTPLQQ